MTKLGGIIMITKKIGIIGCGNMGGAILYGALDIRVNQKTWSHPLAEQPSKAARLLKKPACVVL